MSSSVGQQHPADGAARGAVRADDADLRRPARGVVSARARGGARARRRSDGGEARAGPVDRRALARRRSGDAPPRSTSRVSCERGGLPTRSRRSTFPTGDPVHLPALLAECFGLSTSEARRLIAQGGVRVDGDSARRARRPAGDARRRGAPGRQAPVRAPRRLTEARQASLTRRETGVLPSTPALREGGREVCHSTTGEPSSEADTTCLFRSRGPLVRVGGFLFGRRAVWSLKTQQRETSRPLAGVSLREEMNPSSFPLEDDRASSSN